MLILWKGWSIVRMGQYHTAKMLMLVLWHNIVDNWLLSAAVDWDIIQARTQGGVRQNPLFVVLN